MKLLRQFSFQLLDADLRLAVLVTERHDLPVQFVAGRLLLRQLTLQLLQLDPRLSLTITPGHGLQLRLRQLRS